MWSWSFPEGLAGKIMGFLNADIHRQYFLMLTFIFRFF
jgi:hypothetical protein